ncbi:N-acetylmuramoyl-L-alanine amidase [Paenibacillus hemerocallicola]|uniref:N-acetylmuramoyl-L-alanine amidase n=1 Tax=Paenibacillus hemerocallicola TaxID=1172614 RepID=A0A5C4T6G7_9BACL|nr:N-acetylmuramoyl-L-alanine amidase [Paenibacillus hemerocallicola]TNJ64405.1 N-acetylmuramoyl-L-alanine amidase [Paenibacillus hemerocallicola]
MKPIARKAVLICGVMLGSFWHMTDKASAAETYKAQVVADVLNIRGEPASRSDIVGSLKKGEIINVSDEAYGWVKIEAGKKKGWVAGHYLKKLSGSSKTPGESASGGSTTKVQPGKVAAAVVENDKAATGKAAADKTAAAKEQSGKEATVLADTLYVRSGPGADNEATGVLSKGTRVTILKRDNGWVQVRAPGVEIGWVSGRYLDETGSVQIASERAGGGLRGKLIVIDPGHGGADPGVIGSTHKTVEKTINMTTAQYVADELRRAGAQVYLTRTSDKEQPELEGRAEASNKKKADAFVSIHYNASPKKVSGTLTYYYSEAKDRPLARSIEARLAKGLGLKSNGISYGDYHVLRENNRPSVLLELGFLTDSRDEATVRKDDYQKKAAAAIAAGLADYFAD